MSDYLAQGIVLAVVIYSIVLHEGAHAVSALWFGDDTAKRAGRVTFNPIPSIDPIGSVALPILCSVIGAPIFGWAKPVPVNSARLRPRVLGDIVVSLAGIVTNLLIAFLVLFLFALSSKANELQAGVIKGIAFANVALALFNLLPIPPLDGHHVAKYLLPREWREPYERVGFAGIVVVLLALQVPPVRKVFVGAIGATFDWIAGLAWGLASLF